MPRLRILTSTKFSTFGKLLWVHMPRAKGGVNCFIKKKLGKKFKWHAYTVRQLAVYTLDPQLQSNERGKQNLAHRRRPSAPLRAGALFPRGYPGVSHKIPQTLDPCRQRSPPRAHAGSQDDRHAADEPRPRRGLHTSRRATSTAGHTCRPGRGSWVGDTRQPAAAARRRRGTAARAA
jgi:hypothetical protein